MKTRFLGYVVLLVGSLGEIAAQITKKPVASKVKHFSNSVVPKIKQPLAFCHARPGVKDFRNKNLAYHDLSGSNLCDIDFTNADFSYVRLNKYTNFEDARLVNVKNLAINPFGDGTLTPEQAYQFFSKHTPYLSRVTWSDEFKDKGDSFVNNKADFLGKNLAYCDLRGTNFTGVDLTGADLTSIELWGGSSSFKGAILRDIKHRGIKPSGEALTKNELIQLFRDSYGCDITDAVME